MEMDLGKDLKFEMTLTLLEMMDVLLIASLSKKAGYVMEVQILQGIHVSNVS